MSVSRSHRLRAAGLRVTDGRVAILEAIENLPHSDAEALLGALRDTFPGTSVQSVHNMLHDLTKAGLLRRIEPAGSPSRYEIRTGDNHHHLVCSDCGAVADVDCAIGEAPCLTPSHMAGYAVSSAEVTFWGLCESCQTEQARLDSSTVTTQRIRTTR